MRFLFIMGFLLVSSLPVSAGPDLKSAESIFNKKQFDQARAMYLDIAKENHGKPDAIEARFRAALCLFEKKDFHLFKSEADSLLADSSNLPQYTRNGLEFHLARISFEQGNYSEAAFALGQVARQRARSVWGAKAGLLQGEAYRKLKQYDRARQAFLQVCQDDRKKEWSRDAHHRAAQCLFEKGDYEAFSKECNELLPKDELPQKMALPFPSKDHWGQMTEFLYCQISEKKGRPLDAAQSLEKFMKRYPGFRHLELAQHRCGRFYMEAADQFDKDGKHVQAKFYTQRGRMHLCKLCDDLKSQVVQVPSKSSDYRLRFMILENYFYAREFKRLYDEACKLSSEFPSPSKLWAAGMIWQGISLTSQSPPQFSKSAAIFDAILAANVTDNNLEGHIPTKTAYWRAVVAQRLGDRDGLDVARLRLIQMPEGPCKTVALDGVNKLKIDQGGKKK